MTAILGISAFYHDSAAAVVRDGEVVAAAQEERFSRAKHDAGFPEMSIAYCLAEAGLSPDQVDYVAFYDKPFAKFERLLETFLAYAPRGFGVFRRAIPEWLRGKLNLRKRINRHLGRPSGAAVVFPEHHESHAASAFFPSPFEEAAILTMDGVGEWTTTAMGTGRGNTIELTHQIRFPHSLGLLYSAFTYHCGFEVNEGEYKLMGLAPYGEPVYRDLILERLIDLKPDGSFRLNMDYFRYGYGPTMTNRRFDRLFGGKPRAQESELSQRHKDMAASVQAVTEEAVLRMGAELHRRTKLDNLVMAGGVALNCVANGRLLREGPFESLWVQPAAGDAGGALGAALFVWHQLLGKPLIGARSVSEGGLRSRERQRREQKPSLTLPAPIGTDGDTQHGSLLGPAFSCADVRACLDAHGADYQQIPDLDKLFTAIAADLDAGKVVGWLSGRMEFGPRALGSRSILADPRRPEMQSLLNQKIKMRESFRPFAPAVLAEHAAEWFDLPRGQDSPYMLVVAPVAERHRGDIPAVTHVDGTARVQTVDPERSPALYGVLRAFYRRTNCPVLVNTSFNVRGEPIVCAPGDAYRCFRNTGIDILVMEDCVVRKSGDAGALV